LANSPAWVRPVGGVSGVDMTRIIIEQRLASRQAPTFKQACVDPTSALRKRRARALALQRRV
jgi:hypothetical protein